MGNAHDEAVDQEIADNQPEPQPEMLELSVEITQADIDAGGHSYYNCPGVRAVNRALAAAGYAHLEVAVSQRGYVTVFSQRNRVESEQSLVLADFRVESEQSLVLADFVTDYDRQVPNPNYDPKNKDSLSPIYEPGPKAVPQTIVLRFDKAGLDELEAAAAAAERSQVSEEDGTE